MGQAMCMTRVASIETVRRRLNELWADARSAERDPNAWEQRAYRAEDIMLVYLEAMRQRAVDSRAPGDVLPGARDVTGDKPEQKEWAVAVIGRCTKEVLAARLAPTVQRVAAVWGNTFAARVLDLCLDVVLQPDGPAVLHLAQSKRHGSVRRLGADGKLEPMTDVFKRVDVVAGFGHRLACTLWPGLAIPAATAAGAAPVAPGGSHTEWQLVDRPRVVLERGTKTPILFEYWISDTDVFERDIHAMQKTTQVTDPAGLSQSLQQPEVTMPVINRYIASLGVTLPPRPDLTDTYIMTTKAIAHYFLAQKSIPDLRAAVRDHFRDFHFVDCARLRFVVMPMYTMGLAKLIDHSKAVAPAAAAAGGIDGVADGNVSDNNWPEVDFSEGASQWRLIVADITHRQMFVLGGSRPLAPAAYRFATTVISEFFQIVGETSKYFERNADAAVNDVCIWPKFECHTMWQRLTADKAAAMEMLLNLEAIVARNDWTITGESANWNQSDVIEHIVDKVLSNGSIARAEDETIDLTLSKASWELDQRLVAELVPEGLAAPAQVQVRSADEANQLLAKVFSRKSDAVKLPRGSWNCEKFQVKVPGDCKCNAAGSEDDDDACNCLCACHVDPAQIQPELNAKATDAENDDADAPLPQEVESHELNGDDDADDDDPDGKPKVKPPPEKEVPAPRRELWRAEWGKTGQWWRSDTVHQGRRVAKIGMHAKWRSVPAHGYLTDFWAGNKGPQATSVAFEILNIDAVANQKMLQDMLPTIMTTVKQDTLDLKDMFDPRATNDTVVHSLAYQNWIRYFNTPTQFASIFPNARVKTTIHISSRPPVIQGQTKVTEPYQQMCILNHGAMLSEIGAHVCFMMPVRQSSDCACTAYKVGKKNAGHMKNYKSQFMKVAAAAAVSDASERDRVESPYNHGVFVAKIDSPSSVHIITMSVDCGALDKPGATGCVVHRQLTVIMHAELQETWNANIRKYYAGVVPANLTALQLFQLLICPSDPSKGNVALQSDTIRELHDLLVPNIGVPGAVYKQPPNPVEYKLPEVRLNTAHDSSLPQTGLVVAYHDLKSSYTCGPLLLARELPAENISPQIWNALEKTFQSDLSDLPKLHEPLRASGASPSSKTGGDGFVTGGAQFKPNDTFGVGYEYLSTYSRALHLVVVQLPPAAAADKSATVRQRTAAGEEQASSVLAMNYMNWAFPSAAAAAAADGTKKIILAGILEASSGIRPDTRVPGYPNANCGEMGWGRLHGLLVRAPTPETYRDSSSPDSSSVTFECTESSPGSFLIDDAEKKASSAGEYMITAAVDPAARTVLVQYTLILRSNTATFAPRSVTGIQKTLAAAQTAYNVHQVLTQNPILQPYFGVYARRLLDVFVPFKVDFRYAKNIYKSNCDAVWRSCDRSLRAKDSASLQEALIANFDTEFATLLTHPQVATLSKDGNVHAYLSSHNLSAVRKLQLIHAWNAPGGANYSQMISKSIASAQQQGIADKKPFTSIDFPLPAAYQDVEDMFAGVADELVAQWLKPSATPITAITFTSSDASHNEGISNDLRKRFNAAWDTAYAKHAPGHGADSVKPADRKVIEDAMKQPAGPSVFDIKEAQRKIILTEPMVWPDADDENPVVPTCQVVCPPRFQPPSRVDNPVQLILAAGDVTQLQDVDVIVNPAVANLSPASNDPFSLGDIVCTEIFKSADYNELKAACTQIVPDNKSGLASGSVAFTPSSGTLAENGFKAILHAVHPKEAELHGEGTVVGRTNLRKAYQVALDMCYVRGYKSIAFSCLGIGYFNMNRDSACLLALTAIGEWLSKPRQRSLTVYLVAYSRAHFLTLIQVYNRVCGTGGLEDSDEDQILFKRSEIYHTVETYCAVVDCPDLCSFLQIPAKSIELRTDDVQIAKLAQSARVVVWQWEQVLYAMPDRKPTDSVNGRIEGNTIISDTHFKAEHVKSLRSAFVNVLCQVLLRTSSQDASIPVHIAIVSANDDMRSDRNQVGGNALIRAFLRAALAYMYTHGPLSVYDKRLNEAAWCEKQQKRIMVFGFDAVARVKMAPKSLSEPRLEDPLTRVGEHIRSVYRTQPQIDWNKWLYFSDESSPAPKGVIRQTVGVGGFDARTWAEGIGKIAASKDDKSEVQSLYSNGDDAAHVIDYPTATAGLSISSSIDGPGRSRSHEVRIPTGARVFVWDWDRTVTHFDSHGAITATKDTSGTGFARRDKITDENVEATSSAFLSVIAALLRATPEKPYYVAIASRADNLNATAGTQIGGNQMIRVFLRGIVNHIVRRWWNVSDSDVAAAKVTELQNRIIVFGFDPAVRAKLPNNTIAYGTGKRYHLQRIREHIQHLEQSTPAAAAAVAAGSPPPIPWNQWIFFDSVQVNLDALKELPAMEVHGKFVDPTKQFTIEMWNEAVTEFESSNGTDPAALEIKKQVETDLRAATGLAVDISVTDVATSQRTDEKTSQEVCTNAYFVCH